MQTCQDIIELLSDYMDGQLPAARRVDLEAHLALCTACLEFMQSLRETQGRVRNLRCDDMPVEVHDRLRAFLDRTTKGRRS